MVAPLVCGGLKHHLQMGLVVSFLNVLYVGRIMLSSKSKSLCFCCHENYCLSNLSAPFLIQWRTMYMREKRFMPTQPADSRALGQVIIQLPFIQITSTGINKMCYWAVFNGGVWDTFLIGIGCSNAKHQRLA